jgi:NlpE N-terminal domain
MPSEAHMAVLLAAVLAAGALTGCTGLRDEPLEQDSTATLGTFAGVLPCADCAGIRTELTLFAEQPSGRPVRYELKHTYLGTRDGDRTFEKGGRTACDAGTRLRVQFVSSPGGSTSRLELEIASESPTTWPKAA